MNWENCPAVRTIRQDMIKALGRGLRAVGHDRDKMLGYLASLQGDHDAARAHYRSAGETIRSGLRDGIPGRTDSARLRSIWQTHLRTVEKALALLPE